MSGTTALVWLRNDLRLADNPALLAAVAGADRVLALYIHEDTDSVRATGAAARWWLHRSLEALNPALAARGIVLDVVAGDAREVVPAVAERHRAQLVCWNRRYGPGEREADAAIKQNLRSRGVTVQSFPGNVLAEPWDIATGKGTPYAVFTPFWKALKDFPVAMPAAEPSGKAVTAPDDADAGYREPRWAAKLAQHCTPGEAAAQRALAHFFEANVDDYPAGRDYPARPVTSRLSAHLRFGEISPRQVWHTAQSAAHRHPGSAGAIGKFLSELAWRDFSYHQLYHREDIATVAMQPRYRPPHWRQSAPDLDAWQRGRTGLPIIDAGMRELWETGYMQNRVRMLVASLLVKNLLIDWRAGERWFWDCLVDADVANNPFNWQWVAGCGLDAAPYFRIFNPVTQGERFDAAGEYVRRWVPELAALPDNWIHNPAGAPDPVLRDAGIVLGKTYPSPIVDLKASRQRALDAAAAVRAE